MSKHADLLARFEPHFAWTDAEKLEHYRVKGWELLAELAEEAGDVRAQARIDELEGEVEDLRDEVDELETKIEKARRGEHGDVPPAPAVGALRRQVLALAVLCREAGVDEQRIDAAIVFSELAAGARA